MTEQFKPGPGEPMIWRGFGERMKPSITAGTMVISGTGSIPECGVLTYKAPTQDSERAALLKAEVHRLRQQVIALTRERDAALREIEQMREHEPACLPLRRGSK